MYIDPVRYGGNQQNHEKMHMFARDIIRVRNPLPQPFRFKYDSIWYTVPAQQTWDNERYLTDRFVESITDHILGQMFEEEANKAISNYQQINPLVLLSPYIKSEMVLKNIKRKDDKQLQEMVVRSVVVGLVKKFGEEIDVPEEQSTKLPNTEPLYRQLLTEYTRTPLSSAELQQTMPGMAQPQPQQPAPNMQQPNPNVSGNGYPNPAAFMQQPMNGGVPPYVPPQPQQQPMQPAPNMGTPMQPQPQQPVTTTQPVSAGEVTQQ